MVNEIVSAISNAIYNEFGDDYDIYTESVEQGLNEPCFIISESDRLYGQFLSNRYKETNLFLIQYFPATENIRQECNNVAQRLEQCLEVIGDEVSFRIRGSSMNSQIVDDILNFSVNYNFFTVNTTKELSNMEELEVNELRKE